MKDANGEFSPTIVGRLVRGYSVDEARRRNALSRTTPGLLLCAGDVVTVVDKFEGGRSFLIEFSLAADTKSGSCDWMGVVPASDVELIGDAKGME